MRDQILRLAFHTVEAIDRLCDNPETDDEDFERLLAVRTPLYIKALAAKASHDTEWIPTLERLTRDAEQTLAEYQPEAAG